MHGRQYSRNSGHEDERWRPPQFACDGEHGLRSEKLPPIGKHKTDHAAQLTGGKAEQVSDSRILQRGCGQSPVLHRFPEPACYPCAEFALGIEKKPPAGMASFAFGHSRGQRNHGFLTFFAVANSDFIFPRRRAMP